MRNLSVIYYRSKQKDGTFNNVCFEELTEKEQNAIIQKYGKIELANLCKLLAKTINKLGEQFNIHSA